MTTVPPAADEPQRWRKSSFSGEKQECVEVADLADGSRLLRDTDVPDAAPIPIKASSWQAFIKGVKAGEFD